MPFKFVRKLLSTSASIQSKKNKSKLINVDTDPFQKEN